MKLVVDASAAVEYLLRTPLGLQMVDLLEASDLVAPELLDAEVLSVLRRETLAGRLDARRAQEALEDLRDWDVLRISHRDLVWAAWMLRNNMTAYDALYVAAAQANNSAVLTADGPVARAPSVGVIIHSVRRG